MQRFIERYEAGERFEPEVKQKPTLGKQSILDIADESKRTMYKYIYMLEHKYGSLRLADENDPLITLLRKEVGAWNSYFASTVLSIATAIQAWVVKAQR